MKPSYLCSLISCCWPTWLLPDVSVYHAKTFITLEQGQTLHSDPYPESINWLYALMHNKYIPVLFRFTTNKKISDLINTQYKSTTKSIQIEICDPVIYHVRFLSLNCLIEDMIIPIHSLICPLYCPAVRVRTKD